MIGICKNNIVLENRGKSQGIENFATVAPRCKIGGKRNPPPGGVPFWQFSFVVAFFGWCCQTNRKIAIGIGFDPIWYAWSCKAYTRSTPSEHLGTI
jgi:hypothetical protein